MKLWLQLAAHIIPLAVLFSQDNLAKAIVDKGFENVYRETKNDIFLFIYENRKYRSELEAMDTILSTIIYNDQLGDNIKLIPLNRGIPIATVNLSKHSNTWHVSDVSLDPEYSPNSPENTSVSFFPVYENWRENPSYDKWEITFTPDVRAKIHTNDGIIRFKFNALSGADITLGKGLKFHSQIMIPIYYQYDKDISEIKPGSNYLNYTTRLKNDLWVSISTGMFHWKSMGYNDELSGESLGLHEWYRYGITFETVKYFSNGKIKLFFKADQTGHLSYRKSQWFYSQLNDRFTWYSGIGYRFDYPDLFIQAGFGQDLYKNNPLEIKVIRSFSEIDLGLFVNFYEGEKLEAFTGGASISVPLPYLFFNKKKMTISSAKRFNWSVWYHAGFGGRYPKGNNSIDIYQKRLFPTYINNNKHLIEGVH